MRNLSSNFKTALLHNERDYLVFADITLSNGTVLHLTNEHIWSNGFSTEDAVSDDSDFTALGATVIGSATLVINNMDDDYTSYTFDNAEVVLQVGKQFVDSGGRTTLEKIKLGTYTVDEATYSDSLITLSLLDKMEQFDRPYTSSVLEYPATLDAIVREACTKCDVPLQTYNFPHKDFVVQTKPEEDGTTYREVIGWAATIAGCFARCNADGNLELKWFDRTSLEQEVPANLHYISDLFSQDIALDDTIITGVSISMVVGDDDEIQKYTSGTSGYVIEIEDNAFITTPEEAQAIVTWLGAQLIGLTFTKVNIEHLNTPAIEAGDVGIVTDRKNHTHPILVTRTNFAVWSTQTTVCGCETPGRNSATRFSGVTKAFLESRKLLRSEKTARQQQYDELDEALSEHSGLYSTVEHTETGDIYYFHDMPALEDSTIIWKMTRDAWGVSTDGGQTWNAGMTVDGDAIVRILSATGVNADWIDAGSFVVRDANGNIIFNASTDTHSVYIGGASVQIGGGKSLNGAISDAITSANNYTDSELGDYSSYVSDKFQEIEGRLDGQVESWYYAYDPTLNNAPASSWTTEALKQNHEGDVFTNTTTEVSYRFVKENGTWQWKLISDSLAAQALAAAINAQDTADHKRRVFYETPYPPYDQGDLWVEGSQGDIWRCAVQKAEGTSYSATDWVLASKYTDDSSFTNFVNGDYATTIQSLQTQLDGKSETWYQETDPAIEWATAGVPWIDHNQDPFLDHALEQIMTTYPEEAAKHEGDLWKRPSDNKEFIFKNGEWVEMQVPDEVFDEIDGKAQIFGVEPYTPYHVGDLWFTGNEIRYCQTERLTGNFNAGDWIKKDYYTDDSALQDWIDGDFADIVEELQAQADEKAETWYQGTNPANAWDTPEKKALHTGDLWYCTANISGTNFKKDTTWYWNGTAWQQQNVPQAVFDEIDGKAQIFVNQPTTPYNVGDLWFNSDSSDIMTCITARASGNYNAGDWQKRNKYTDDSELTNFVDVVYTQQMALFQAQIDNKVETWYQANDPAESWATVENDTWIDSTGDNILDSTGATFTLLYTPESVKHEGDLWHRTSDNKEFIYKSGIWEPMDIPDELFDMVDGKAQIFTTTPTVPYNKDDMWFTGQQILVSTVTRKEGTFNQSDWVKKDYYTDDSAFTIWKNTDYKDALEDIQDQTDKKAETWYQNTNPANAWTTADLKALHKGDLWYCTVDISGTNYKKDTTWYWNGSSWQQQNVPQTVFDDIDGKAQIFTTQPTPPYNVGDLWFNSTQSDIKTCVTSRASGSFNDSDWQKRNKYTDDSTFTTWQTTYEPIINGYQNQIDGKIETWNQDSDPSTSWDATAKNKHVGDIWYAPTAKLTKRYTKSGNVFSWTTLQDIEAQNAASLAAIKRRVFTSQPSGPYDVGDLWWTSTTSGQASIKIAKTARSTTGAFNSNDWIDPKYVDSSQVAEQIEDGITNYDTSLGQTEIFNKLTNGGADQGVYLDNGKVYINATYILSGTLAGNRINGRNLTVLDNNNQTTLAIDANGNVTLNATELSIKGKNFDKALNEANNLLLSPIDLSSSYWTTYGTRSNGYSDPDGGTNAIRLYQASSTSICYCQTNASNLPFKSAGTTYKFSVWLKAANDNKNVVVSLNNGASTKTFAITTSWRQYSFDYEIASDATIATSMHVDIRFTYSGSTYLYIYNPRVEYTDPMMTQAEIMNRLTNGTDDDGIYLYNGQIYLRGQYIVANSISAEALAANAITSEKIAAGAITAAKIASGTITANEIAASAITSEKISSLAITTGKLAASAVTTNKIAADAVTASKINVSELSALDATIGGFTINPTTIHATITGGSTNIKTCSLKTEDYTVSGLTGKRGSLELKDFTDNFTIGFTLRGDYIQAYGRANALKLCADATDGTSELSDITKHLLGYTRFTSGVEVAGSFTVSGTKSAIRDTEHYGKQAYYCYETPNPMFGDIGDGTLDETGTCIIAIDDIMQEACTTTIQYFVFLQKCGDGDCWVSDRQPGYFIVKGTPGLTFSWELKAKQTGYEYLRYNDMANETRKINFVMPDYANEYNQELETIQQEMEESIYG